MAKGSVWAFVLVVFLLVAVSPARAFAAHFGYRELDAGQTGEDVSNLQIILQQLGYYSGAITGRLDDLTQEAVRHFQQENGLRTDGRVTGECLRILNRLWEGYSLVVDGYPVGAGETLDSIARDWGVPVRLLKQLNGIPDDAVLGAGQRVIVPVPGFVLYRVKTGDTLSKIARKYGVSVEHLVKWNRIAHPDRIIAGELLLIFGEETEEGGWDGADGGATLGSR